MVALFPETGGLFRLAVKLMMAHSTTNCDVYVYYESLSTLPILTTHRSDYVPLIQIFGIFFQIRDDYMNLQSTQVRCISLKLPTCIC